jgi:tetratricopeptide (TPR) repeat protein
MNKQKNTPSKIKKTGSKTTANQGTKAKSSLSLFNSGAHLPKWIYGMIIALAFVFYGNTMLNEYALDDTIVFTQNEFVKRGVSNIPKILKYDTFLGRYGEGVVNLPGGRYRPLSLVTLAIEYDLFADSETKQIINDKLDQGQNDDDASLLVKTQLPYINHFMNIALYAITACVLLLIMLRLFPLTTNKGWKLLFNIPVLTAIFFVAHPLHSEAVANIKGRDEIMTLLGALLALYYTLRWLDTNKLKYLVYSFLAFLFGLFSKENAITFLVVIPLTVYCFTQHSVKRNFISLLPLFAASLIFLAARAHAINSDPLPETELMNNPFMHMLPYQKWATIIYVLGRYLLLLILPYPLTTDYYPYYIPIMSFSNPSVIFFTLFYLALGIFTLWGIVKKNIYAYTVIWFIVPLSIVSNIFVQIGTFMNERFVYISSIGFCLLLAYVLIHQFPRWIRDEKKYRYLTAGFVTVLLCLYAIDAIPRNRAWHDDFTLSTTDVKISFESAKANYDAARVYNIKYIQTTDSTERAQIVQLINNYSRRAVEIHPKYENALMLLAWSNGALGQPPDSTVKYLLQLIRHNPHNPYAYDPLALATNQYPDSERRLEIWKYVAQIAPQRFDANYNVGSIYGKEQGRLVESVPYFEKAVSLDPENVIALIDLGAMYGMTGKLVKAIEAFERAVKVSPTDTLAYKNLWVTYSSLGDVERAQMAYNRYMQLREEQLSQQ